MSMSVCLKSCSRSAGRRVCLPIQRMTWREAMDRFGSDKPDLRFGMELKDVSDVVQDCEFVVFKSAIENGGTVRGINAEGQGGMPRKRSMRWLNMPKASAQKVCLHCNSGGWYLKSSFSKFMTAEQLEALVMRWAESPAICFSVRS